MLINPLHTILRRARKQNAKRILILWNRGLGDIPLGLYALTKRIHEWLPDASITYLTRPDLALGFSLLPNANILVDESMQRGVPVDLSAYTDYDLILEKPNPTKWCKWAIGKLIPRMHWDDKNDALVKQFNLPDNCLCAHVDTETGQHYRYEKNWPQTHWEEFFSKLNNPIVLLGNSKSTHFGSHVIDLRGETNLLELIAILKCKASHLIAPDSGILSFSYYIDANFPLKAISLWSDPKQGILRGKVPSPNPGYEHIPLIAKNDLTQLSPNSVLAHI